MPIEKSSGTALARRSEAAIATPSEFNDRLVQLREQCHILTPAMHISAIAPMHSINVSYVQIDSDVKMDENGNSGTGSDVYFSRSLNMKPNERALRKESLMRLAAAGGGTFRDTKQAGDLTIRDLWSWTVMLDVTMPDGTIQSFPGSATVDCREGSAQIAGQSAKQIDAVRRKGPERAETLAMERAVRAAFGLKQKYTVEELKRPFAAFKLIFAPDPSNQMVQQMITAKAIGAESLLYAQQGPRLPVLTGEVVREGSVTVDTKTGEVTDVPAEDGVPFMDEDERNAPEEQLFTVTGVFKVSNGYYITTAETGTQRLTTTDQGVAQAALRAHKAKQKVALLLNGLAIEELSAPSAGEKL